MLEWIASPLDPITHQDAFDPKNPYAAGNVIFYQSATAEARAGIGYGTPGAGDWNVHKGAS